jgi:hypothetical protein
MSEQSSLTRPEQQTERLKPADSAIEAQGADLSRPGANADYNAMKARAGSTAEAHLPQGFGIDAGGAQPAMLDSGDNPAKPSFEVGSAGDSPAKPSEGITHNSDGTTTVVHYDERGNRTDTIAGADGKVSEIRQYGTDGTTPTVTTKYDGHGVSEVINYKDGKPANSTKYESDGGTTVTEYGADGSITEQTKNGPDGRITGHTTYRDGKPAEYTAYKDDKPTETIKYGADGSTPSESTKYSPDGKTPTESTKWGTDGAPTENTKYGPDGKAVIEHTTYQDGKPKEQTEYDPADGHKTLSTIWRADGTSTTLTYDQSGNVTHTADWDVNGNPSDTKQEPGSGALVGNSNTHVGFNKEGQIVQYWDPKNHEMVYLDKDHHWKECGYENGKPDYEHSSDLGTKAPVLDPQTGELKAQDNNCREGRPDGVLINGVSADVQSTRAAVTGAALTAMGTIWLVNTYAGFVPVPRAPVEPVSETRPSQG